ncbi:TetR/AcrR family transcriptional regulator [Allorhizocola rhizosphaerae]|uniref:TetR/AcrR family transcriptional regulator n=1 Tax=Allorhizocola rhizosphaerae TaxID=1872709 RepID=UPI000E3EDF75|nr:WHG domain-containing protein [Allorhizocola rhizosphaerae]
MSPRAGLSPSAVIDAALEIVDAQGHGALTLASVAARTGVATPSLYKHVAGLAELRALAGARVMSELAQELTDAVMGLSRDEAVSALLQTGRSYVVKHPHRYALMPLDALHHPLTADAGAKLINVLLAVLRGYGLRGAAAVHATRCMRVIMHGFASLEAAGGFGLPERLDDTYQQLIDMFVASLPKEKIR